jgi:hypothetical protein
MPTSLFRDVPLKAKVVGWAIIFIPLFALVFLGAMFLRPEPIAQRLVWGCYVADDAPPLDIRKDAIYIIEPARRSLSYVAEPSKTSYQLSVRPALLLTRELSGRYAFVPTRGDGFFWPLLPAPGKNRDRVRHPEEFAGLIRIAADVGGVVYSRTRDADACRQ